VSRSLSRRSFLALGAAATTSSLVAACAPSAPGPAPAAAPRRGGSLILGASADPLTLDPGAITDEASQQSAQLVFESLVRYTSERKVEPSLAESWTVNDRDWTFKLRKGVVFHDGSPFNAAAVKAHFDRIAAEKLFSQSNWAPYIVRIDVVDEGTVRFVTKDPDPFFLSRLVSTSASIESPDSVKKYGKDVMRNPVGTGPFRFGEWVKDDRIVVTRSETYWGQKAYLDKVTVRPLPDLQARSIAVESGDVHMAIGLTADVRDRLKASPNVTVVETTGLFNTFVGMNVLKKPFDDIRVRQALNHAIDKQAIVKNTYQGAAVELPGHVMQGVPGYAQTPAYAYDPPKAKQLLAAAGYANGFTTTLLSSTFYAKDTELISYLQQQYAAVGVTVKILQLEWTAYLQQLRLDPRNSPVEMWRDSRGSGDASFGILRTYGCDFFRPNGGNTNGYCNPSLDAIAKQGGSTVDQAKSDELLAQAQRLLTQEAPSVWLFVPNAIVAHSKKVRDPLLIRGGTFTPTERTWIE